MRILIVTSTLSFGGAERTASNLSTALSRQHVVTNLVFHGNITYPYGGDLIDLKLPYEPEAGLLKKIWKFSKKAAGLQGVCKQVNPDIIFSLTEGPNLVVLANSILGKVGKVIVDIQSPPREVYRGLNKLIYTWLIRNLYPKADVIIPLSKGVASELVDYYHVPKAKIRVIYNPIDLEQISDLKCRPVKEYAFQEGVPVILTVGRLAAQKNQALLIRAFARVLKRIQAHLLIIGSGPLENDLKCLADLHGIRDQVFFLGWQSNPYQYMYCSQVFVLSSDYEGFGNVIVEAMACGCPVISSNCNYGPSEILEDGRYGVLFPPGDEDALVEAICRILSDASVRKELSESGEFRANEFSLPRITAQFEELISGLE